MDTLTARANLERLIKLVEQRMAELPDYSYETRHEHDKAVQALAYDLEQREGARFGRDSIGNDTVRLAGIRSTCSSGVGGALGNWCNNARKRLGYTPGRQL